MAADVYEVSAEVQPTSSIEGFPADCDGAYVYCYVSAPDLREAIARAESALGRDGYRVVDLDHALRVELDEYEPHGDDYPQRDELSWLQEEQHAYGPFLCFPEEP